MNERTPTVDELIDMLEIIKKHIAPHLSPMRMTTLILDIYPESAEFILNAAIEYLQETKERK